MRSAQDANGDAAAGATRTQIASEVGVSLPTVGLWRRSFCESRLDGLVDPPRSGRPRRIDDHEVWRVGSCEA